MKMNDIKGMSPTEARLFILESRIRSEESMRSQQFSSLKKEIENAKINETSKTQEKISYEETSSNKPLAKNSGIFIEGFASKGQQEKTFDASLNKKTGKNYFTNDLSPSNLLSNKTAERPVSTSAIREYSQPRSFRSEFKRTRLRRKS